MSPWVVVSVPVEAKVGPVHLRLFSFRQIQTGVDEADELPWAWGALSRVTFRFGKLTTSKRITSRYPFPGTYSTAARPSEAALAEGRRRVLADLQERIAAHGIEAYNWNVIEEEETRLGYL